MTEEVESAAQVVFTVNGTEVTVVELDTNKEINVEELGGSNHLLPAGYSITSIRYRGSMTCNGSKHDLESEFFDAQGKPIPGTLTVTHMDGTPENWNEVLLISQGYQMREGEVSQTAFEWVAMSKDGDTDQ